VSGLFHSTCATLHEVPQKVRRSARWVPCRRRLSHAQEGQLQEGAGTLGCPAQELWDSAQELWDLTPACAARCRHDVSPHLADSRPRQRRYGRRCDKAWSPGYSPRSGRARARPVCRRRSGAGKGAAPGLLVHLVAPGAPHRPLAARVAAGGYWQVHGLKIN